MKYDFDTLVPRTNTASIKWDYVSRGGQLQRREAGPAPLAAGEVLPLWVADMDFPAPQPVREALQARVAHGIFGYTQPSAAFFAAIAQWQARRKGWPVEQAWIVPTAKVMMTINLLVQILTEPGDGIIVQTPVFHPIYLAVVHNGRQLLRNRLQETAGQYQLDFADLEAKARDPRTKMLILCSPHNPVGRVWTRAELTRIGDICVRHQVYLVVDEIHSDLVYSWATFTTFGALGPKYYPYLVICQGPSKTFNLPGLQISYALVPDETLRARLQEGLRNLDQLFGVSTFGALALEAAYREGEAWLTQVLAYLEANYLFLRDALAETLPALRVVQPEALYLVWLDCRGLGRAPAALAQGLYEEAGVYLESGEKYGAEGAGFMRINIACPRILLEEALARMARHLA
jgi:cystathionine beta-lyase